MAWPLIVKVMLGLGAGAFLFGSGAKAAGGLKSNPTLLAKYQDAKLHATDHPERLGPVADELERAGFKAEAEELRALAKTRAIADAPTTTEPEKILAAAVTAVAKIQAQTPVSSAPVPVKTTTTAVPTKTTVTTTANTTVKLTATQVLAKRLSEHLNLLVKAQGSVARAKGKEDTSLVRTFQQTTGLKNDGLYGPKSAAMLGRYWGDVPLVFYWPKGSQPNVEVPKFRSNLETLALEADQKHTDLDTMRAKMLRLSAFRERGQGYGTGTAVAPSTDAPMTTAEAQRMQQQVAQMFFS